MQPQSKPVRRAGFAAIAVPEQRTVGVDDPIERIRSIRIWPMIREWTRRWRQRRELRSMSQREIADFCPKLTNALNEADKPFWRQ
jgi:uncharacterized protein YjiS (DUF1127 family)